MRFRGAARGRVKGRRVAGADDLAKPRPLDRFGLVPPPAVFAHQEEAALAHVFDAHWIGWLYEPHTFPLERAVDGTVTRAFTPDFFLPEIGIYVECTVARRGLTTGKRQKARTAERLYGIVVEIADRA